MTSPKRYSIFYLNISLLLVDKKGDIIYDDKDGKNIVIKVVFLR